jgi:hypothetical protein
MRNNLVDLNNHLFEQMERLNDDELTDDQLHKEIERSKAMANIATKIIDNADLGLQAERLKVEYGRREINLPEMLENKK